MTMRNPIQVLQQCPASKKFHTAGGRGGSFTVKVRDAGKGLGVEFVRDSGSSKSVSAQRFMEFWSLWLTGRTSLGDYHNQSGKQTKAAAASYLLPVFAWIAEQK